MQLVQQTTSNRIIPRRLARCEIFERTDVSDIENRNGGPFKSHDVLSDFDYQDLITLKMREAGCSIPEIAEALMVSPHTIETSLRAWAAEGGNPRNAGKPHPKRDFSGLNMALDGKGKEQPWSLERFSEFQPKPIRWLWPGYLALGKLTTFCGEPGDGKSLTALDIAARVTTEKDWPDGSKNTTPASEVLLLTVEEDAADTILPRFLVAGGQPARLRQLTIANGENILHLETDLARLSEVMRDGNFKLVILGPVLDFTRAQQNVDKEVRAVLTRLVRFAEVNDVAVIGINHLNKKSDLAATHRVAGARAWTASHG